MSKLLATLLAGVFAAVTVSPVAFADKHMKDEGKKEMTDETKKGEPKKKGEGAKQSEGKKGEPQGDPKKGDGKKKDEPK